MISILPLLLLHLLITPTILGQNVPVAYEVCKTYLMTGQILGADLSNIEFTETGESCGLQCANEACDPPHRLTRVFKSAKEDNGLSTDLNLVYDVRYHEVLITADSNICRFSGYADVFWTNADGDIPVRFDPSLTTGPWQSVNAEGTALINVDINLSCKPGSNVTECSAGSYMDGGQCVMCPPRLPDSHQGATSVSDCFTTSANAVVSCPFAGRLVAYNNDNGENERLNEKDAARIGVGMDIAFVSTDRFLAISDFYNSNNYDTEGHILEFDADGNKIGTFARFTNLGNKQNGIANTFPSGILKMQKPGSSDVYIAIARENTVYIVNYEEGKDGKSVDGDVEISDLRVIPSPNTGGNPVVEKITSMTVGKNWNEILLTTSYTVYNPSSDPLASGARIMRICAPLPSSAGASCNRPSPMYVYKRSDQGQTAYYKTIASLPKRNSLLFAEATEGTSEFWSIYEISMEEGEDQHPTWPTTPSSYFHDENPNSFYKVSDIIPNEEIEVVYIESPDLTAMFDYNGISLGRFEEKIGYTTEPDQLAFKPGVFASLSTFETFAENSTHPSTTVVAGEIMTAKATLRDRYDTLISQKLTSYEVSRFTLQAHGEVSFAGSTFETDVKGVINITDSLPAHSGLYGEIVLTKAGTWDLHFAEGKQVSQTVGNDTTILVVPARTDPQSCSIEHASLATAGDLFEIELTVHDRFMNPTFHPESEDVFVTWSNHNYSTALKTRDALSRDNHMSRKGSENKFDVMLNSTVAGELRIHVAHELCITDKWYENECPVDDESCIVEKCEVKGSPASIIIEPANVLASKCVHNMPKEFESTVIDEMITVNVKVFDTYSNARFSPDTGFTMEWKIAGCDKEASYYGPGEKKPSDMKYYPIVHDKYTTQLEVPALCEGGILTYSIYYGTCGDEASCESLPKIAHADKKEVEIKYVEVIGMMTIVVILGGVISAIFLLYLLRKFFKKKLDTTDNVTEMQEITTNVMAFGFDTFDHMTDWYNYLNVLRFKESMKIYFIMFLGTGLVSTIFSIIVNFIQMRQIFDNKRIAPDDELTDYLSSLELWARENNIDEEIRKMEEEAHDHNEKRRENMKLNPDGRSTKRRQSTKTGRFSLMGMLPGTKRPDSERSAKRKSSVQLTTGKNFAVKQGTIMPAMSGSFRKGMISKVEKKLNETKIELLKLMRERHEHCVDRFISARARVRALVGLTVVICEDTPLLCMQFYLLVYGCPYHDYYTYEAGKEFCRLMIRMI